MSRSDVVLSSPVTRSYKSTVPASVFGFCTLAVLFVNRDDIESWETAVVLVVIYACAAWSLWRPFGLKVADQVEERGGALWIRRGTVEVQIPYSGIERHDYLSIGTAPGIRLVFREPNALGQDIGMYLHVPLGKEPRPAQDPVEYLELRLQKYRDGPGG